MTVDDFCAVCGYAGISWNDCTICMISLLLVALITQ